eukprot:TRINITY_DN14244_c0_g1_i1.p1 TRINITY_DN14244_c0_g1~~TRINITY_DN14244_c0_g1_i1.p1  ORF type:complete len:399 (+),score=106.32 TRINITY_DN14244_c0_g1_i1:42-1199(+)
MSQLKFYGHYEQEPSFTQKYVWEQSSEETVESLIQSFVSAYNETNGTVHVLDAKRIQATINSVPLRGSQKVVAAVKEGDDVNFVDFLPLDVPFKCGRNGCGKEFCEQDNTDTSCSFHPGVIVFHEGYKGWKCCTKREIDFDDALKIEGCATGRHVPEAPKLLKPKVAPQQIVEDMKVEVKDGKEVYSDKFATPKSTPQASKPVVAPPAPVIEAEIPDPADAVIAVGTACLHHGCKATFKDDSSRVEPCEYHPGIAVFHEGSKGWSCCKAKALEFDQLFALEGCTTGVHKFVRPPPKVAKLRHDFYLSGNFVIVSMYSKGVKPGSTVTFEERQFTVKLILANGDVYEDVISLAHPCDPAACRFSILSTKVEIKIRKTTEDWDPFTL